MAPRLLSSTAAKLASIVGEHVDSNRGMTNAFVEAACRAGAHLISPWFNRRRGKKKGRKKSDKIFFRGVFCADKIPRSLLRAAAKGGAGENSFTFVVNLARSPSSAAPPAGLSDGHFVFVQVGEKKADYVDPFGLPCSQPDVRAFLDSLARRGHTVRENRRPIQSPLSLACGLYSILFAFAAEVDVPRSFFSWDPSRLSSNDRLCLNYIRQLLTLGKGLGPK
jgi:hypothetical protein